MNKGARLELVRIEAVKSATIYIYIFLCVGVCMCVCVCQKKNVNLTKCIVSLLAIEEYKWIEVIILRKAVDELLISAELYSSDRARC